MRQLAARAETDPGYVSRLLALLEREELVRRNERGSVAEVDVPGLIRRWADRIPIPRGEPRAALPSTSAGRARCSAGLREADIPHAVTGRASAAVLAHQPLPAVIACYVDNPERAARRLDLPAVRDGANVVLLEPFDPVVFAETWERDGVRHAAPSQIAADLLGSPRAGPAGGGGAAGAAEELATRLLREAAAVGLRPRAGIGQPPGAGTPSPRPRCQWHSYQGHFPGPNLPCESPHPPR